MSPSDVPEARTRSRVGVAPRWVLAALALSFLVAFGVASLIYRRYVAFERRAARHLIWDAQVAVRADLENVAFYAAFRDELLPLVQGTHTDPRLKPRLIRLSQHSGVELGVDIREIAFSRGRDPDTWVLAVSGMFPKAGVVQGIHDVLAEEGHEYPFDRQTQRLSLPGRSSQRQSVVVQQASDSVVLFASDPESLASALAPSERYQVLELGLGEPALSAAFLAPSWQGSGAGPGAARLNAALRAADPSSLQLVLHDAEPTRAAANAASAAASVVKVTGLSGDSIQFKVDGPTRRVAQVRLTSEQVQRVVQGWAAELRRVAFPAP